MYFADTRGGIAARGATDLSEIWTVSDLPNGAEAPILLGSVLVVAGLDGTVTGLGAATGDERWKQKLDATVRGPLGGSDDRVVVGSMEGTVFVLSSEDGQVVHELGARGPVQRSPAIADGIAYVAADSGVVTAFDLATGAERWTLTSRGTTQCRSATLRSRPRSLKGNAVPGSGHATCPHRTRWWRSTCPRMPCAGARRLRRRTDYSSAP